MFLKPNPIAHVDIAAAERAFPEVLGFAQRRSADLFAHAGASRLRLVDGHDHGHVPHKKSGPGFPRLILTRARRTSGRAAISIYIATTATDVKLPTVAPQDQQRALSVRWRAGRGTHCTCQTRGAPRGGAAGKYGQPTDARLGMPNEASRKSDRAKSVPSPTVLDIPW
jgi:hypothetical protein